MFDTAEQALLYIVEQFSRALLYGRREQRVRVSGNNEHRSGIGGQQRAAIGPRLEYVQTKTSSHRHDQPDEIVIGLPLGGR